MASVAMANNGGTTPSDQIRQMVNFILQEAHEKANEIRVKVRTIFDDAIQLPVFIFIYIYIYMRVDFVCFTGSKVEF